jgi:hypothetical protein
MFSRVLFFYDRHGNLYPDPVEVNLKQVRGAAFDLYSTDYRAQAFGTLPAVQIKRTVKTLATDPWNEDGRPPSVMFLMVCPKVNFVGRSVEIIGFEHGNMIWAGLIRAAYEGCPPIKGVPKDRIWNRREIGECPYEFTALRKQVIILRK